jgi:repressor LexA
LKNIQVLDMIKSGDTMALKDRLRQLRKQAGYSQEELAKRFGYKSFTTIQKWEDGTSTPPMSVLQQLAALYHVSFQQLLGERDTLVSIPVLGVVRGGSPIEAYEQEIDSYPTAIDEPGEYFYLRVVGDSMINARIYEGDDVFVRRQSSVVHGDIAVIMIEDEATLKRVYFKENLLILQPENDKYEPMTFTPEQIEQNRIMIIGKVLHNRISFTK